MTEKQIIANNKVIANFMGYKLEKNCFILTKPIDLYSTNWNWLMKVIDKIESLTLKDYEGIIIVTIGKSFSDIEIVGSANSLYYKVYEGDSKILNTYNACIDFIKWYNKNKDLFTDIENNNTNN